MTPVITSDWSGKCLDADGNNGNEVELYTCLGYSWQRWELREQTLRNRALGGCLDVKNCPGKYKFKYLLALVDKCLYLLFVRWKLLSRHGCVGL